MLTCAACISQTIRRDYMLASASAETALQAILTHAPATDDEDVLCGASNTDIPAEPLALDYGDVLSRAFECILKQNSKPMRYKVSPVPVPSIRAFSALLGRCLDRDRDRT